MSIPTIAWDHTRPDPHPKSIGTFTDVMNSPVPPITDWERERVCHAIDKRGLWGTDLPSMLGLVES